MNICHFSYSFLPLVGGMEAFIDNLARCQLEAGITPTVFTPYVRKKDNDLDVPYQVSRFSRPTSKRIGLEQLLLPLALLHKHNHFDLIHCHDAFPCGYVGHLFSKLTNVPFIITSHGGDIVETEKGIVRSATQTKKITQAYSNAQAICAISNDMKSRILSLGAPVDKVKLIHNGVHVQEFATESPYSTRWEQNPPYLLCLGRLVKSKGVDILINAFKNIAEKTPDVILKIAGGGKAEEELRHQVLDVGMTDRIKFLGVVRGQEKIDLLQHAVACVSPTLKEAFGIVNIEALAAGTPVIASRVGGIPDIIEDNKNGLLVPPGDEAALSKALDTFIQSRELADRLAKSARPSAEPFDWQVISRDHQTLYKEALELSNDS